MKNNIIYVSLNDSKAESTLCQYDKGQILQFVEEVPDGVHVLLSNQKSKLADRKIIVKNQVEILDDLLEESGTLTVNVQIVDESSETTTKTIRIDVLRRKDANDDIAPENQQTFIEQVQEIMTATKSIAKDVQDRADNGEFDGFSPTAVVTKEDNGVTITIEDRNGTTSEKVLNGEKGFSPSIETEKIENKTIITITDKDGTKETEINDGVVPVYDEESDYVEFINFESIPNAEGVEF